MTRINPIGNNVVVLPDPPATESDGGIIIPERAREEDRTMMGTVVAVGPGEVVDGFLREAQVSEGQRVLFSRYSGSDIKVDDKDYIVMDNQSIIAIVEEE